MKKLITLAGAMLLLTMPIGANAAQKTVKLAVENMNCASCPYIVKQVLKNVPGVNNVDVSYKEKTATVTFDDSKANVENLTRATLDQGYPSQSVGFEG